MLAQRNNVHLWGITRLLCSVTNSSDVIAFQHVAKAVNKPLRLQADVATVLKPCSGMQNKTLCSIGQCCCCALQPMLQEACATL